MISRLLQTTIQPAIVLLLTIGIAAAAYGQDSEFNEQNFRARQSRLTEMRQSLNREELLSRRSDGAINNLRPAAIAAGELDPTFNANVQDEFSSVNEIVAQPDGKILVGGTFQSYNGTARENLVRLNTDGTIDAAFQPVLNGNVQTLVLQPDGKIVIAGNFSSVNGTAAFRIARLNADGTTDTSFNAGTLFGNTIFSLAVQSNGKIVVGGSFTVFFGVTTRQRVAVLNSDGSLDAAFNAGTINSTVFAVASQADNKILIGGLFSSVGGMSRPRIARLHGDGGIDFSFNPGSGLNSSVLEMVLQPDGKIVVGGFFSTAGGQSRNNIARFNANGTVDAGFDPGTNLTNSLVDEIRIQADGKILIGGQLNEQYNGPALISFRGTRRLNVNGSPDTSYDTGNDADSAVGALAIQADGKILVGGFFNSFNGNTSRNVIRLNDNGSVDGTLLSGSGFYGLYGGGIYKILRQPDGKILIGGFFTHVGGARRDGVARLNADGSLDATFNPGSGTFSFPNLDNPVFAIALQTDGKILIGGFFDRFNGSGNWREASARLNPDGSLDATFGNSGDFDLIVYDLAIQADGKILQAGIFPFIKRLNADGTRDATFSDLANNTVNKVVIQGGKILIGGAFTTVGGMSRNRIARLNFDGTLDTTFNPGTGADSTVNAITLQTDGKILVGGSFNNFNGAARNHLARLNDDGSLDNSFVPVLGGTSGVVSDVVIQSDGNIIAGGTITNTDNTFRTGVARLTASGSPDNSFNTAAAGSVLSLTIQPDGKILIGGFFRQVNGVIKNGIARLLSSSSAPRTLFDFDGDGKADVSVFRPSNGAWYLQQSLNGFAGVSFGISTDRLVPADYDGDGKTDIAVYRGGTWYLQRSQLGFTGIGFGEANDIPVPADYDADGKADVAVFRPSTGVWYLLQSTAGFTGVAFGQAGDKPVAADYDGDGKTDVAVFRAGTWYIQRSQLGFTGIAFGDASDKPVPADYDGDGKADVAVFRQSNGVWYLQQSTAGFTGIQFGLGTDLPVPADYDGDGKSDVAVFRDGTWYLQRSQAGFMGVAFGTSGDKPIPNAFVP